MKREDLIFFSLFTLGVILLTFLMAYFQEVLR